jgi:hypothetical protein
MEATYSSQTLVDLQRTTRRYIPKIEIFITTAVGISNPTLKLFLKKEGVRMWNGFIWLRIQ